MSKMYYYICEQDDIDHDFKIVRLKVNRTLYPQALVCKRCGSVFDLGGVGANIKQVISQLSGMDLTQYRLKEATETNQAIMLVKKMAKASRSTASSRAFHKRLLKTVMTPDQDQVTNASPWRMNG